EPSHFNLEWCDRIAKEPLLKIKIDDLALLAGNWSQLCETCKAML
ncbi:hypothetical protein M8C21_026798, partial [Ambrosia artemisiifolia]